jgi:ParB-like chromosome segregation protein Spo0J
MSKILSFKISRIKPNPKNPRVVRDDSFKKLVESVKEFPQMLEKRSLVCYTDTDGKLVVLGGNQRLKALREIGAKEAPVILADDLTAAERQWFHVIRCNAKLTSLNLTPNTAK